MSRNLLAREALTQIPKILTWMDRNPHSPTYGCFDRIRYAPSLPTVLGFSNAGSIDLIVVASLKGTTVK
jgi:hypothetical protein